MKKLNSVIKKLFYFALGLSIGFPLGVVLIIIGATNHQLLLLILGIMLSVLGFYAMPILWIQYGEKQMYKSLLSIIENEYIYSVEDLALQTGKPQNKVRNIIKHLINNQYLSGYIFKNDVLQVNNNAKQKHNANKKCPNCGAKLRYCDGEYVCDYCSK